MFGTGVQDVWLTELSLTLSCDDDKAHMYEHDSRALHGHHGALKRSAKQIILKQDDVNLVF